MPVEASASTRFTTATSQSGHSSAVGQRTGAGFSTVRTPAARAVASTARVVAKGRLPCIMSQSPGAAPASAAAAMSGATESAASAVETAASSRP